MQICETNLHKYCQTLHTGLATTNKTVLNFGLVSKWPQPKQPQIKTALHFLTLTVKLNL